jgi:CheY-like chemotaxis protein
MMPSDRTGPVSRVLIVDDSATIRGLLRATIATDRRLEVVGEACDPYEARDLIKALDPDIVTLDVEMPRMNGLDFSRTADAAQAHAGGRRLHPDPRQVGRGGAWRSRSGPSTASTSRAFRSRSEIRSRLLATSRRRRDRPSVHDIGAARRRAGSARSAPAATSPGTA